MINKVNLEGVKAYGETAQLPLGNGGYVLKIMGVEVKENSVGQYMEVSCDIAEGPQKDFFTSDYRNQNSEPKKWHCVKFVNIPNDDGTEKDNWAKTALKTFLWAVEESNPGFHWDWDETKLKGKLVGGLFRVEEYLGRTDNEVHETVRLASFTVADKIRTGAFRALKPKRLKGDAAEPTQTMTAVTSDDLPF